MRLSLVNRECFITTKCSWMDITRECSPNDVAGNPDISLKNIKRDKAGPFIATLAGRRMAFVTYKQIIEEYKKGRCRSFGTCNHED